MNRRPSAGLVPGLIILGNVGLLGFASAAEVPKIEDNSFLVEEAYNQEPGIIQHIQTFQHMKGGAWSYSFTEEWPLGGRDHQISFTLPFTGLEDGISGVGDVGLNYRWQAHDAGGVAFAPRFTVLLPLGNYRRSLGMGTVGLQMNLPLSIELAPRLVTHWNAGGTWLPGTRTPTGHTANTGSVAGGASAIWIAHANVNLMLECLAASYEILELNGSVSREELVFVNPGVRFALNFPALQVVPGISVPIGVGPSKSDSGVFFYLSLEHRAFGTEK